MDKQEKVFDVFGRVIPKLTDPELDRLLAYGEGIAFKVQQEDTGQPFALDSGQSETRPGA